jgi:hypothetical protein
MTGTVTLDDRTKRAYDHIRLLHTTHGSDCAGRWIAISLADGSCDTRLYETKAEAVRFQLHETQCAYFHFSGIPKPLELQRFLELNVKIYDAGLSLSDPETYVNPEAIL